MRKHLSLKFLVALVLLTALTALPAYAQNGRGRGLEIAIAAQEAHSEQLLTIRGVAGTGVGLGTGGQPVVVVYLEMSAAAANVPDMLDNVPVKKVVTGRFNAYAPPPLNADFTWSCSGLTCDFDASSTTGRGKKSYSWDFGDSRGEVGEKVSHTYTVPELYTVILTASNSADGIDSQEHDVNVTVSAGGGEECLRTEWCNRPVPIGVSVGHPNITAGTIGARVKETFEETVYYYALSNNHVLADQNDGNLGDSALQPGPFDGGVDLDDSIGTLSAFVPIEFNDTADNTVDAAIALSDPGQLGNSTLPDGYGTPSSALADASLGLLVQKDGRTTGWTLGVVSEINVTVLVCYEGNGFTCTKLARFVDQIAITPGDFSAGGDSGSLIVTRIGNSPVGLLFAGSSTRTIANKISTVLESISTVLESSGVTVDGGPSGTISGTVTDDNTNPIVGATVSTDSGQFTTTDAAGSYEVTVPVGDRTVTASAVGYVSKTTQATVTDDTATANFSLSQATEATSVSVYSIAYATEGGKNSDKHLLITVALKDAVSGASVSIKLDNSSQSWTGTATTGANGTVTFTLKNAPSGCYTMTVTGVTADGLTWDSNDPRNVSEPPYCK